MSNAFFILILFFAFFATSYYRSASIYIFNSFMLIFSTSYLGFLGLASGGGKSSTSSELFFSSSYP